MTYRSMSALGITLGMLLLLCPAFPLRSARRHRARTAPPLVPPLSMSFRGSNSRFIPPLLEERLQRGQLTPQDLERMFGLTETDIDVIQRPATKGYAGVVFDLDTALVDLTTVLGYSLAALGGEMDQPTPHPLDVRDTAGNSMKDTVLALQWGVDVTGPAFARCEERFYTILHKFMDALPVTAVPGAAALLDAVVQDGNAVTVITSLPRGLAIKALQKAQLSRVLEGRVSPDHLVCPLHLPPTLGAGPPLPPTSPSSPSPAPSSSYGGGPTTASGGVFARDGALLLKCCGLMRKPAVLTTVVSGNKRTVLSAKRLGLNAVALPGLTKAVHELRASDKVLNVPNSLVPLLGPRDRDRGECKELYTLTLRAIKASQGPELQTAAAAVPIKTITKSVAAASDMMDRRPKDTFADEFGSDTT